MKTATHRIIFFAAGAWFYVAAVLFFFSKGLWLGGGIFTVVGTYFIAMAAFRRR